MDDFELRKDWETRYEKYFNGDILKVVTATDFLASCTLVASYKKGGTVSCKKKDVLNLSLDDYKKYADDLQNMEPDEAERMPDIDDMEIDEA